MDQSNIPFSNRSPDLYHFLTTIRRVAREDQLFRPDGLIAISRTPGRLDLMGGNDDYTGGLVFEATIQESTIVAVQSRSDQRIRISNPQVAELGWEDAIEYNLADFSKDGKLLPVSGIHEMIQSSPKKEWAAYVVGGIYLLLRDYHLQINTGISVLIESDIPLGKGVSSSAALEVASLKSMASAYGIDLRGVDLAIKCQWIENVICKSASGVMDQITVVLGEQDHFVPLVCQPCQPEPLVRLPASLFIWGIDSGVRHQVAGIEYEAARAATFMGYQMICRKIGLEPKLDESSLLPMWRDQRWNGYLANLSPSEFRASFEPDLPESILGADFSSAYPIHYDPFTPVRPNVFYPVKACTRYAVEENHRVNLFVELLSEQNKSLRDRALYLMGELMYQSHQAYKECGLGSDGTDLIVDLVRKEGINQGLYGAKITGGGAGGTVAIMAKKGEQAEDALQRVIDRYHQSTGYLPYIFKGSSPGADAFGVLGIDAASLL